MAVAEVIVVTDGFLHVCAAAAKHTAMSAMQCKDATSGRVCKRTGCGEAGSLAGHSQPPTMAVAAPAPETQSALEATPTKSKQGSDPRLTGVVQVICVCETTEHAGHTNSVPATQRSNDCIKLSQRHILGERSHCYRWGRRWLVAALPACRKGPSTCRLRQTINTDKTTKQEAQHEQQQTKRLNVDQGSMYRG